MEEILPPQRKPDVVVEHQTTAETPLLYRYVIFIVRCYSKLKDIG
jgi:hypothetical protein